LVFSLTANAQVYYSGGKSDAQKKAAAESKAKLKYDPHDLSGMWQGGGGGEIPAQVQLQQQQYPDNPCVGNALPTPLMGGAPAPPMTPWAQAIFDARKPSAAESWVCRKVPPALGNDTIGTCDPEGYPRSLRRGPVEFVQTPDKIVQIFDTDSSGMALREIFLDGRTIPDDVDPRWYGWAVGHWEGGNTLVVESTGYDERSWLDGNGWPHSEDMKLTERYTHPDAETLIISMTLVDPKAYTKPWVGKPDTFKLALPKGLTVNYEERCVPSENESFNRGVRNPAGGNLSDSRPLR